VYYIPIILNYFSTTLDYISTILDQTNSLDILNSFIIILIIKENKWDIYYKRLNYLNKDYLIKIISNISRFNNKLIKKLKAKNTTNCKNYKTSNFTKYNNLISFKETIPLFIINIDTIEPFKIKGLKEENYFISLTNRGFKVL